jgi:hypothetical protein
MELEDEAPLPAQDKPHSKEEWMHKNLNEARRHQLNVGKLDR